MLLKRIAATCEKKLYRTYDLLSRTYEINFFHMWQHYASVECSIANNKIVLVIA